MNVSPYLSFLYNCFVCCCSVCPPWSPWTHMGGRYMWINSECFLIILSADESFVAVDLLQERHYMLSVLIPITCGILGAMLIVCVAYGLRNCNTDNSHMHHHRQVSHLSAIKRRARAAQAIRVRYNRPFVLQFIIAIIMSISVSHLLHWFPSCLCSHIVAVQGLITLCCWETALMRNVVIDEFNTHCSLLPFQSHWENECW